MATEAHSKQFKWYTGKLVLLPAPSPVSFTKIPLQCVFLFYGKKAYGLFGQPSIFKKIALMKKWNREGKQYKEEGNSGNLLLKRDDQAHSTMVSVGMERQELESSTPKRRKERKKPGDTTFKPLAWVETGTKCLFYVMFICMICNLSLHLRTQEKFQKWYVLFVFNAIRHLVTGSSDSHFLVIGFYLFRYCVSQEVHGVWSSSDLSQTTCKQRPQNHPIPVKQL